MLECDSKSTEFDLISKTLVKLLRMWATIEKRRGMRSSDWRSAHVAGAPHYSPAPNRAITTMIATCITP